MVFSSCESILCCPWRLCVYKSPVPRSFPPLGRPSLYPFLCWEPVPVDEVFWPHPPRRLLDLLLRLRAFLRILFSGSPSQVVYNVLHLGQFGISMLLWTSDQSRYHTVSSPRSGSLFLMALFARDLPFQRTNDPTTSSPSPGSRPPSVLDPPSRPAFFLSVSIFREGRDSRRARLSSPPLADFFFFLPTSSSCITADFSKVAFRAEVQALVDLSLIFALSFPQRSSLRLPVFVFPDVPPDLGLLPFVISPRGSLPQCFL